MEPSQGCITNWEHCNEHLGVEPTKTIWGLSRMPQHGPPKDCSEKGLSIGFYAPLIRISPGASAPLAFWTGFYQCPRTWFWKSSRTECRKKMQEELKPSLSCFLQLQLESKGSLRGCGKAIVIPDHPLHCSDLSMFYIRSNLSCCLQGDGWQQSWWKTQWHS